uniref:Uncharacterized protein n=1 Tax=Anopheles farauti TaxID=69004 RepID=A0A182QVZ6_9DIPT
MVLLVSAILVLDSTEATRQDALKAFQPLKPGKQQRKLIAGGSELFLTLQTELILSQEPYVQEAIDDEATVQVTLTSTATNTVCARKVSDNTDVLMKLAGLSLGNCVAKIDDEMFVNLYPTQNSAARQEYTKASLLSSFEGVNIFSDPLTIQSRIVEKLNNPISGEGLVSTSELSVALKSALKDCLQEARALMKTSMDIAASQASSICIN